MKKSVAIIILALSTLSIIFVGLFFQKAGIYNVTKYIEEIVITSVKHGDDYLPVYTEPFIDDNGEEVLMYWLEDVENPGNPSFITYVEDLTVQILYDVIPDDTTNKKVSFYAANEGKNATVDEDGFVTFKRSGSQTIILSAEDGSNVETQIRIRAKKAD